MHAIFANHWTSIRTRPFAPAVWLIFLTTVVVSVAAMELAAQTEPPVRFNRDIRPIMSDTCFKCHGPGTREAGLRLDVRDEALKAADSGEKLAEIKLDASPSWDGMAVAQGRLFVVLQDGSFRCFAANE